MVQKKKFFTVILLMLSLISISFSAYPEFDFSQTQYSSGEVDISGLVSPGVQLELFINNRFIKTIQTSNTNSIYLNDNIENQNIKLGESIRFINNLTSRIYQLNITDASIYSELNYLQELSFFPVNSGTFNYRDEQTNTQRRITVDEQTSLFNFSEMHSELEHGTNNLTFKIKPILISFEPEEFEVEVNYNKYSNTITITNYTNVSNTRDIKIRGYVTDRTSPLNYVINIDGTISNHGALKPIEFESDSSNYFNITLLSGLVEGKNSIRFISTDAANTYIFNGETKINVKIDTQDPYIDILTDFRINTNVARLGLNISTDADVLYYTFNGNNDTFPSIINNTTFKEFNLELGQNNLTLIAKDMAGNEYREAHTIKFDNTAPDLVRDELEPEEVFNSPNEVHFLFQKIKGKTTKPNVDVTVFTLSEDAKDDDGNRVTCESYENMFYRNLGDINDADDGEDGVNPEMDEMQLSISSLIFQKQTFTTDSDGDFDNIIIGLQEKDFSTSDVQNAGNTGSSTTSPTVNTVESNNKICFILEDEFGNTKIVPFNVKLDAGNTMWRTGEITTIPNTVYAAEIERTGDVRSGTAKAGFGIIFKFQYIGSGEVSTVQNLKIQKGNGKYSKYVNILSQEVNWKIDKETGEGLAYIPIDINALGMKPLDYPDNLEFWFDAYVTYTVDDIDIPIDVKNPIHFKATVNIERPLDHTKWLTPSTINKLQEFLNKTIKYTEEAVDKMGIASLAGTVGCIGANFYYNGLIGIEKAKGKEADQAKINDHKRSLYNICDRVLCNPSPAECTTKPLDESYIDVTNGKVSELGNNPNAMFESKDGQISTSVDSISLLNNGASQCKIGNETGVYGNVKATNYEYDTILGAWKTTQTSGILLKGQCMEAKFDDECTLNEKTGKMEQNGKVCAATGVSAQSIPSSCYTPAPPKFDDLKCNFFGLNNGIPNRDSKDNIIESVMCGCITDTYSHLKNYLKIQQSIYQCLEQAKIGVVKGSYCERLVSQAVCDVATNIMFKSNFLVGGERTYDADNPNAVVAFLKGVKDGDKELNNRYAGSFLSQAGLSSDQIVNKACLAAITGDWSVLTDNILGAIDANQVEPTLGPLFAESRMEGYDPLTGALRIKYLFTYAGVSGGSLVRSKVKLICDSSADGGEYCPEGIHTTDEALIKAGSSFSLPTLTIPKGGSKQDSISIDDNEAMFWFNKIEINHEYELNGEVKNKKYSEIIFHKGEMLASCYFTTGTLGSGAGIQCGTVFNDDSLISAYTLKSAEVIPSQTFYSGNELFVDLVYSAKPGAEIQQTGFDLVYKVKCPAKDGTALKLDSISVPSNQQLGEWDGSLFTIPQIGLTTNTKSTVYSQTFSDWEIYNENIKENPELKLSYYLEIESTTPDKYVLFKIKNIDGLKLKTDRVNVVTGGDLEFKDGEDNIYTLNIEEFTGENVIINTEAKYDVKISIYQYRAGKKQKLVGQVFGPGQESDVISNSFESGIQTGTCNLEMRIVAPGEGANAKSSESNFDNYNPFGDSDSVATNVQSGTIQKLTFNVASTPKDDNQKSAFKITSPKKGSVICVKPGEEFNIEYIYQTSNNLVLTKDKLEITTKTPRYPSYKFTVGDKTLKQGKDDVVTITLPGTNSEDNTILQKELVDMELNYDLAGCKDYKATSSCNTYSKAKGSIEFKINTNDDCKLSGSKMTKIDPDGSDIDKQTNTDGTGITGITTPK